MKEKYFEIYLFANSIGGRAARILLVLASFLLLYLSLQGSLSFKVSFVVLAFVLINELYLVYIAKTKPENLISQKPTDLKASLIFSAREKFELSKNGFEIAKSVMGKGEVKFFKEKLGIETIPEVQVLREELLKQAFECAAYVEGKYITETDLLAAYILLSEDETSFLQDANLNNGDVINILYWTRRKFKPDIYEHRPIYLLGPGVFDSLVYGWNYELKKYSRDKTLEVLSKHFSPTTIGREKEYDELVVALSKHRASNVIIIGNPGTGKKSLVEHLAYHSFIGDTPHEVARRKVFELLVDKLLSGISNPGDLESRLTAILIEISHSGNAIVFIQNIENIFGGGGFDFDMSGVLDEYLTSEKIKIIGTTTPAAFANYIQEKRSVADLFEKINLSELPPGKTLLLLTEKARETEKKYGLEIKYSALKQSVNLSQLFFPDRSSPGRDIDLLEDVASKAKIDKKRAIDGNDVVSTVQSKTKVVLEEPDKEERELLLDLEEKLHTRVIGQDEAVGAIAEAMRRVRSGFRQDKRPIASFLFLGPTGVGKTETAKVLAGEYFGSRETMIRLDMSEYQTQDQIKRLLGTTSGEEYLPNTLTELVEKQPFSLVLLDEFEKAHPHLLDLFLQVYDEGRLTDNKGKTVSFKNTIIIATSNAGSELLRERQDAGLNVTKQELIDYLLKNNIFKPELINRFDEVVVFHFLNQEEIKKVAQILIAESLASLEDNQIKVAFDEKVIAKVAIEAYDPTYGARNIRRYIESNVEDYLSKQILENKVNKGDRVTLSVDSSGNWTLDNRY